jgi:hypothetical protein
MLRPERIKIINEESEMTGLGFEVIADHETEDEWNIKSTSE